MHQTIPAAPKGPFSSDLPAFSPEYSSVSFESIRPLLQKVARPGRYAGGEFGIPARNPQNSRVRALLSYPDTYELGMSNEGLKILYDAILRHENYLADRAFLPWPDMGQLMQEHGVPLYSLDHFLCASSFDMWGFNIVHELHYSNLLYALDLAQIPLLRKDRRAHDPFIIAGGTAITNPLPLYDFADAVFLGDGEEAILEILGIIAQAKESRSSRPEILTELNQVSGLLVFSALEILSIPENAYAEYAGVSIQKRIYRSKQFADLEHVVIPSIAITQDRAVVEVTRGCGQGCRFCHAGFWKRPVRNAEVSTLVETAGRLLARTGHDSISLHALSIADYPWLEELVVQMANRFGPDGIALSLPSMRVQIKTLPVLEMTAGIRRSSVTFALEAGSELQRERIHKKSSEENLHYLVREIFSRGWDLAKVYFMLGLPDLEGTETEDLIRSLNALGALAEAAGPRKHINVSVSLFVPKPFTTFQWERQQTPEFFSDGIKQIKSQLKSKRVHLKYPDPWMAWVEGLLSRSDHRMGEYLLQAYKDGARFCSWDNGFQHGAWQRAIENIPEGLRTLWADSVPGGSVLPWHTIIDGISLEKLTRDYEKYRAVNAENMDPPHPQAIRPGDFPAELLKPVAIPDRKFQTAAFLEFFISREGPAIYSSHLELATILRKALRRSGAPITFSRGFNKHEKMHFGRPVPLYVASEGERVIVELYEPVILDTLLDKFKTQLPDGFGLAGAGFVRGSKFQEAESETFVLEFTDKKARIALRQILEALPEEGEFYHRKKRRLRKRHLKAALLSLKEKEHSLWLEMNIGARYASLQELLGFCNAGAERWNVEFTITKKWAPAGARDAEA